MVGDHWFEASGIESVHVPACVTELGVRAFYECESLRTVTFAENSQLEYIDEACFKDSALREITLPAALGYIGCDAFDDCIDLLTVYVEDGCEVNVSGYVDSCVDVRPARGAE